MLRVVDILGKHQIIAAATADTLRHLQKSSVAVRDGIAIDFLDPLPISTLQQARRRHDVVAIQITDPHEEQLPALGRMTLEDAETGESAK